uniref:NADH dehydrogenase subunit 6 n=1 Tax=Pila globosa TaxID=759386 RepID=UPI0025A9D241|nr:NADH dehydrogenase subunit 6 [Pila globosa]WIW42430.1 NADH dehydrogenase subunit 6 [Pila globosa]
MTVCMLLSFSVTMMFMLPLMTQPLSMGLVIMMSTFFMCLSGSLFFSSWYMYILFLVYIGGLLVMFVYVAALMPNMLFTKSKNLFLFFLLQILMFYLFHHNFMKCPESIKAQEYLGDKMLWFYGMELISNEMFSIFIGLAIILLLNLIAVVKICYYYFGSLRPYK